APNIIRGGSHSGNIAAAELADAGLLDVLSSDYIPSSLLMAAVNLGQRWGSIAEGMATVTSHPARATGLDDRGGLTPGKRPDLLRFAVIDGMAVVRGVWTRGIQVA
ncbi:MAG: phosphonate metabolism protein PhnM, partial [SAR116 cluster bacterium MED-G04]